MGLRSENKLCDRMIKQLLNSVIVKFRDLSVSQRSIDLQDTNISRCFAQPRLKHCQILQRETPISRLPFMKMVLFVVDKRCSGDMLYSVSDASWGAFMESK